MRKNPFYDKRKMEKTCPNCNDTLWIKGDQEDLRKFFKEFNKVGIIQNSKLTKIIDRFLEKLDVPCECNLGRYDRGETNVAEDI